MSTAPRPSALILREVLRKLPILGLLSDDLLTRVMSASRLARFRKKATLVLSCRGPKTPARGQPTVTPA